MVAGGPSSYYGGMASAPSATRPVFSETTFLLALTGKAWAVAHLPVSGIAAPKDPKVAQPPLWNDLVSQVTSYTDQYLVLTNDGLSVIARRRAVDTLRDLINAVRRGSEETILSQFFDQ